jgi:hypothetical protein
MRRFTRYVFNALLAAVLLVGALPSSARFISVDPVHFQENNVHSFNRYAYGNNNPYRFIDPDGLAPSDLLKEGKFGGTAGMSGFDRMMQIRANESAIREMGPRRSLDPAARLEANRAQGEAFEQATRASVRAQSNEVVEQITIKTQSGVRTRLDLATRDADGGCRLIECKSSATAPLTRNQAKAFPEIEATGGTVVGAGKGSFPGGTQIAPQRIEIIRPE